MNIIPDPTSNVLHPPWCDPRYCDGHLGHAAVSHTSEPVVVRLVEDDTVVSIAVQRAEERCPGGTVAVSPVGALITMTNEEFYGAGDAPMSADGFLLPDELDALARRLLATAALIRDLS